MVEEVPSRRLVGVFFLSETLNFCSLQHVVQLVIVWIFAALVVVHLKHARERTVSVEDLSTSDEGKAFRERFKDFEPAIECFFRGLLTQESLLVEHLNLVSNNHVEEYAEDAPDD